jgi:hypothetical protein
LWDAKLPNETARSSELAASVAALWERVEALARDNEELRRELATRSTAPDASVTWIALKAAYRGPFTYERVRSWCETGVIEPRKEGGRWFLSQASLSARLARLRAA